MNIIEKAIMEMYLEKLYQKEIITLAQIEEIRNIMMSYYQSDVSELRKVG